MLNESDGQTSIRQWKKNVNMYCPRCYRHSDHLFIKLAGSRPVVRSKHKGMAFLAQYKCLTDECEQLVEVEIFVRFKMQTEHMFPPNHEYE